MEPLALPHQPQPQLARSAMMASTNSSRPSRWARGQVATIPQPQPDTDLVAEPVPPVSCPRAVASRRPVLMSTGSSGNSSLGAPSTSNTVMPATLPRSPDPRQNCEVSKEPQVSEVGFWPPDCGTSLSERGQSAGSTVGPSQPGQRSGPVVARGRAIGEIGRLSGRARTGARSVSS